MTVLALLYSVARPSAKCIPPSDPAGRKKIRAMVGGGPVFVFDRFLPLTAADSAHQRLGGVNGFG
jgi:hypothetical protein